MLDGPVEPCERMWISDVTGPSVNHIERWDAEESVTGLARPHWGGMGPPRCVAERHDLVVVPEASGRRAVRWVSLVQQPGGS